MCEFCGVGPFCAVCGRKPEVGHIYRSSAGNLWRLVEYGTAERAGQACVSLVGGRWDGSRWWWDVATLADLADVSEPVEMGARA